MGEVAERLGQLPARPGVGRKALVVDAHRRGEPRVAQVRVELRQPVGHHQAFVDHHMAGQTADVELRVIRLDALLGPPPRKVQTPVEVLVGQRARRGDEHMLDGRQHGQRLFAAGVRVDGHLPPAGDTQALAGQLGRQHLPSLLGQYRVAVQEHGTDSVVLADTHARRRRHGTQKCIRLANQQPAAVTGLAVGRDGAPVRHPRQGLDGGRHQPVRRLAVHVSNQPETAVVALEALAVQRVGEVGFRAH